MIDKILLYTITLFIILKCIIYVFGYFGCFVLCNFYYQKHCTSKRKDTKNNPKDLTKSEICNAESDTNKVKKFIILCSNGVIKYLISYTSNIPSHFIRKVIWKNIYKLTFHNSTVIYKGAIFRSPWKIKIGEGTVVGDDNILDGRGELVIGKHVNMSSEVRIWTWQHDPQGKYFEGTGGKVAIGDRAWISSNVTILPGVTVGKGAVIASGAVVTKDVEPYGFYAGIPAKKIGQRTQELQYKFNGEHDWFY